MRTMRCLTTAMIALTILIVGSPGALAQAGSPDSAVPPPQERDCIAEPVFDAPFSAEAVTAWHPPAASGRPELRVTARYYRDRAGHVRVDFVEGMSQERVIITRGADSREAYELDTANRTAFRTVRSHVAMLVGAGCGDWFNVPVSMNRFVSFRGMPLHEESLGTRSIEGVPVFGTRFNTNPPVTFNGTLLPGERWVSPELKVVVYSRLEDSVVGIVEHHLRKISRTQPPADLFEVPTDYMVPTGPWGCWMWDNPYAPHFGRPGRCEPR
jgi:hypothetical protein